MLRRQLRHHAGACPVPDTCAGTNADNPPLRTHPRAPAPAPDAPAADGSAAAATPAPTPRPIPAPSSRAGADLERQPRHARFRPRAPQRVPQPCSGADLPPAPAPTPLANPAPAPAPAPHSAGSTDRTRRPLRLRPQSPARDSDTAANPAAGPAKRTPPPAPNPGAGTADATLPRPALRHPQLRRLHRTDTPPRLRPQPRRPRNDSCTGSCPTPQEPGLAEQAARSRLQAPEDSTDRLPNLAYSRPTQTNVRRTGPSVPTRQTRSRSDSNPSPKLPQYDRSIGQHRQQTPYAPTIA